MRTKSISFPKLAVLSAIFCSLLGYSTFPLAESVASTDNSEGGQSLEAQKEAVDTKKNKDPSGLDPVRIGAVELVPTRTIVRKSTANGGNLVLLNTVLKFKIRNNTAGDVQVAMFSNFSATDDLGIALFVPGYEKSVISSGLNLLMVKQNEWGTAYGNHKNAYVVIGSKQVVEVQLSSYETSVPSIHDKGGEFMKTYKPREMTFTGSLSVKSREIMHSLMKDLRV